MASHFGFCLQFSLHAFSRMPFYFINHQRLMLSLIIFMMVFCFFFVFSLSCSSKHFTKKKYCFYFCGFSIVIYNFMHTYVFVCSRAGFLFISRIHINMRACFTMCARNICIKNIYFFSPQTDISMIVVFFSCCLQQCKWF